MQESISLTLWQTLLVASLGSLLGSLITVSGQTLIHWLQQKSYKKNELWRRRVERLDELEELISRIAYQTSMLPLYKRGVKDDVAARKVALELESNYVELGRFGAIILRYPDLERLVRRELKTSFIMLLKAVVDERSNQELIEAVSENFNDRFREVIAEIDKIKLKQG